jgi:hypothetical protein
MGMTLEEFDDLSYHEGSMSATKKYFASHEATLFENLKSPRDTSKVKVLCNVVNNSNGTTRLHSIIVAYTDEDYAQTKIERHTLYLYKDEAKELAKALNSIVDAEEKLTEHLNNSN